jgi:hypothetical protein
MTSVLPSAQSLLDDIRTLLVDDGAALSACTAAHMLKVPVILARKLLAAVFSENRNDLRAVCVVSGFRQGQRCVLLVPSASVSAAAASMDASPCADVQLFGICRSSNADLEVFFTREQSMTAHGVLERQLLAEVQHCSVNIRNVRVHYLFSMQALCKLEISLGWHSVCSKRAHGVTGVVCSCRC